MVEMLSTLFWLVFQFIGTSWCQYNPYLYPNSGSSYPGSGAYPNPPPGAYLNLNPGGYPNPGPYSAGNPVPYPNYPTASVAPALLGQPPFNLPTHLNRIYPNTYGPPFFPPLPALGPAIESSVSTCRSSRPVKLDYGDCPQLEPKEEDKKMKEEKLKECYKDLGLNENSTLEDLPQINQDQAKECLIRKQELLNDAGKFQFDKALKKLKMKALPEDKQKKLDEAHVECKLATENPAVPLTQTLAQVQMYNRCMDFHIKMVCGVKEYVPNKELASPNSNPLSLEQNFEILSEAL